MLAAKRLEDVALGGVSEESIARRCKACKCKVRGSFLALKPWADVTRSLKQGIQWPYKKD